MKTFKQYVLEKFEENDKRNENENKTMTFSFDLSKFENAKETVEIIKSSIEDFVTDSTETSIEISCKNTDATKLSAALEILKEFIEKNCHTTRRSSDEAYAQYCRKIENKLNEFEKFLEPKEDAKPVSDDDDDHSKDDDDNKE